jgi:DNA-binding CsgD family transcriptional regulator
MPTPRDLVGRQAEFSQLTQMLAEDTECAVVVSGEPGVGKTALIEQLCARAAADGWQVVRVLGVAAEEPFALGALNQLAFGLKAYQAKLDGADRAVLAPVFGAEPDSEVAVLPLAAGLLNLLAVAGQHQPVLLVVDDVHWLDRVSAEVLGAVGRRLTHSRVRIVAGLRTSHESGFSGAGWSELPLAALDAEDSLRLLESAGVPVPAANRTAILKAAQGNPLALVELPRFGDRIDGRLRALPLTERLVAVFGAQLEALDAGVRAELLRAALDGIAELPFEHTRILLAQGMWLRRVRRHTEARAALVLAAAGFDRLGARPWAKRAQAELRAAGASVKQSLGEAAPLSAQERRVAELAADGQTTKEIAALLSISARTVDGHLYRLFRKLGITSRAGLSKALRDYA